MSRLVARILLSMFMFPLGVMLYALVMGIVENLGRGGAYTSYRTREQMMFFLAGVVTWVAVAAYWWLLWRGSVRWTATRIGWTIGAAAGAAVGGGVIAGVIGASMIGGSSATSFTIFVGGVLAILFWLVATVFIWRETVAERAARVGAGGGSTVTCPTCGYNLTGLDQARCPECGSRFTLNELLAAQPARATAGELD